MPCQTKLYLYSDLEGKLTGEFNLDCAGDCPDGSPCRKRIERHQYLLRLGCGCAPQLPSSYPPGSCGLMLRADTGADGRVTLHKQCSYRPCGDGPGCRICRVRSFGKTLTVLDPDGSNPRIRTVEEFRCECVPYAPSDALRTFYERWICQLVSFALANGSTLSKRDLYHAHVLLDCAPPDGDYDHLGLPVLDDQVLIDHCAGLVGHAHESDGGRSTTADNFNIHVDKDGNVRFAGSVAPVDRQNPAGVRGEWTTEQIHFRFCDPGQACPPCTVRIRCPRIDRDICVGVRRLWPDNDPALG